MSEFSVPVSPEATAETNAEVAKLSSDLLRDFYQTFRLSQGETAIQPPLFTFLADKHLSAGHQPIMTAAIHAAEAQVDALLPPARHVSTSEEARSNPGTGFKAMWDEYSATLMSPEPESARLAHMVLEDMLAKDREFQERERPNRAGSDPHESIVREYIIGDKLTGSGQLLEVRDDLRAVLFAPPEAGDDDTELMRNVLNQVANGWEHNHAGRSFYEHAVAPPVASVH